MVEADAENQAAALCGCWQCFPRKPQRRQRTDTAASAPAQLPDVKRSLQHEQLTEQRRVQSANPPAGPTASSGTSAQNHRYVSLDLWLPACASRAGKEQPQDHVPTEQTSTALTSPPELQLREAESVCRPGPSSYATVPTPQEHTLQQTSISSALVQPDLNRLPQIAIRNAASCPEIKSLTEDVALQDTAQGSRDQQPSTWFGSAKQLTRIVQAEITPVRRGSTGSVGPAETTARAALLLGPGIARKLALALGPELFALLVSGLGTDIVLSGMMTQMKPGKQPTPSPYPTTPIYVGGRTAGVSATQLRAAAITHVVRSMGPSSTAAMVDACGPGLINEIVKELSPAITGMILQQLGVRLVGRICVALGADKLSGQLQTFGLELTLGILRELGPDWVGELIREGLGPTFTLDIMRRLGPQLVSSIIQGFGNDFMAVLVGCIGNKTMADMIVGLMGP